MNDLPPLPDDLPPLPPGEPVPAAHSAPSPLLEEKPLPSGRTNSALPPLPPSLDGEGEAEALPPLPPTPNVAKPRDKVAVLLWLLAFAAGVAALQFQAWVSPVRRDIEELQRQFPEARRACEVAEIGVNAQRKRWDNSEREKERATALGKEVEAVTAEMQEAVRRFAAAADEARARIRELESTRDDLAARIRRASSARPERATRELRSNRPGTSERVTARTVQPPDPDAVRTGALTGGDVITLVDRYVRYRESGDGNRLAGLFADVVNYKYSNFKNVPRSTVMDDIRSGWDKWPRRSYRMIRAGYRDSMVEFVFQYQLRTSSGKRVSGYSKETWTVDERNRIASWTETTNRQNPPPVSPGLTIIEL